MTKKNVILVLCMICISIFGCNRQQNNTELSGGEGVSGTTNVTADNPAPTLKRIGFTYDTDSSLGVEYIYAGRGDSTRLGVDKSLIWMCDRSYLEKKDPAIINYFNELLVNKYGCDFTVELRGYTAYGNKKVENGISTRIDGYQQYLINARDKGEQIDILYTGMGMSYMNTYMQAVKNGLLLKLDDILETDAAKDIKAVFNEAERVSCFCVDGIYCIPRTTYNLSRNYVLINTEYADKLGIEVPKISSIEECMEWLFTLEPYAKDDRTLVFLGNAVDFFDSFGGYVRVAGGLYEHEKADGSWEYVNIAEEEYYHKLWEKLSLLREKKICTAADEDRVRYYNGEFLCCFTTLEDTALKDGKLHLTEDKAVEVESICSGERYFDRKKIAATGIASWSEYKDEAVKLFSLLMSEPELINVINSGIERVHYEIADGKIRTLTTDSSIIFYNIPLNNSYAYTCAGASLEPVTILPDRIKPTGGAIYQTDLSDYFDVLAIMSGAANSVYVSKLNAGELWNRESYDTLLQEFKDKMNELGLSDVVAGLNEQLKAKGVTTE